MEAYNNELRGRRLTDAESDLLWTGDPFSIDEDLIKTITDYMTGPYKREITVICESCGSIGTMVEEMPAGCIRLGIPHAFCSKCIRKMMAGNQEE